MLINRFGIDELKKVLKDNITAFSGNSGVGKSSLINSIFEDNMTQEGLISDKNKKGKNTKGRKWNKNKRYNKEFKYNKNTKWTKLKI